MTSSKIKAMIENLKEMESKCSKKGMMLTDPRSANAECKHTIVVSTLEQLQRWEEDMTLAGRRDEVDKYYDEAYSIAVCNEKFNQIIAILEELIKKKENDSQRSNRRTTKAGW